MDPTALYTHTSVFGPPEWLGPSGTITRLAWTAPAETLIVDDAGWPVAQVPLLWVGKTLRKVAWLPATAVRLSTAAPAVPSVGMLAGEPLTPLGMPLTFTLQHLTRADRVVGAVSLVAAVGRLLRTGVADPQRRDRVELPRRVACRLGREVPLHIRHDVDAPQGVVDVDLTLAVGRAVLAERDRDQVGDVHVGAEVEVRGQGSSGPAGIDGEQARRGAVHRERR